MQKYPEVKITLMLDDKRNDIIADHYDLAFRIGKLNDSNLMAKKYLICTLLWLPLMTLLHVMVCQVHLKNLSPYLRWFMAMAM
ncbi:hypothetical protein P4S68_02810 [Pseudoalteromonas sp. Hal099]